MVAVSVTTNPGVAGLSTIIQESRRCEGRSEERRMVTTRLCKLLCDRRQRSTSAETRSGELASQNMNTN